MKTKFLRVILGWKCSDVLMEELDNQDKFDLLFKLRWLGRSGTL